MIIDEPSFNDPDTCWAELLRWIGEHGCMPDGSPLTESFVEVLAYGAWIGTRFALMNRSFGLGIAIHGNTKDHPSFASVRRAMRITYADSVAASLSNYVATVGMDFPVKLIAETNDAPPATEGLTEADGKALADQMDMFLRGQSDA